MRKLTRVTLEFEDGNIKELRGEEADEWMKAVDGACAVSHIHGMGVGEFNWEVKKEEKK